MLTLGETESGVRVSERVVGSLQLFHKSTPNYKANLKKKIIVEMQHQKIKGGSDLSF